MSNPRNRNESMEFRQQEVGYVMERWRAGDYSTLVGVGSVGKSNLWSTYLMKPFNRSL